MNSSSKHGKSVTTTTAAVENIRMMGHDHLRDQQLLPLYFPTQTTPSITADLSSSQHQQALYYAAQQVPMNSHSQFQYPYQFMLQQQQLQIAQLFNQEQERILLQHQSKKEVNKKNPLCATTASSSHDDANVVSSSIDPLKDKDQCEVESLYESYILENSSCKDFFDITVAASSNSIFSGAQQPERDPQEESSAGSFLDQTSRETMTTFDKSSNSSKQNQNPLEKSHLLASTEDSHSPPQTQQSNNVLPVVQQQEDGVASSSLSKMKMTSLDSLSSRLDDVNIAPFVEKAADNTCGMLPENLDEPYETTSTNTPQSTSHEKLSIIKENGTSGIVTETGGAALTSQNKPHIGVEGEATISQSETSISQEAPATMPMSQQSKKSNVSKKSKGSESASSVSRGVGMSEYDSLGAMEADKLRLLSELEKVDSLTASLSPSLYSANELLEKATRNTIEAKKEIALAANAVKRYDVVFTEKALGLVLKESSDTRDFPYIDRIVSDTAKKTPIKVGDYLLAIQGISLFGYDNAREFAVHLIKTCDRPLIMNFGDGNSWTAASMRSQRAHACESLEYEAVMTKDKVVLQLRALDRKRLETIHNLRVVESCIARSSSMIAERNHQQHRQWQYQHQRHLHQQHLQHQRLLHQQSPPPPPPPPADHSVITSMQHGHRAPPSLHHRPSYGNAAAFSSAASSSSHLPKKSTTIQGGNLDALASLEMLSEQSQLLTPLTMQSSQEEKLVAYSLNKMKESSDMSIDPIYPRSPRRRSSSSSQRHSRESVNIYNFHDLSEHGVYENYDREDLGYSRPTHSHQRVERDSASSQPNQQIMEAPSSLMNKSKKKERHKMSEEDGDGVYHHMHSKSVSSSGEPKMIGKFMKSVFALARDSDPLLSNYSDEDIEEEEYSFSHHQEKGGPQMNRKGLRVTGDGDEVMASVKQKSSKSSSSSKGMHKEHGKISTVAYKETNKKYAKINKTNTNLQTEVSSLHRKHKRLLDVAHQEEEGVVPSPKSARLERESSSTNADTQTLGDKVSEEAEVLPARRVRKAKKLFEPQVESNYRWESDEHDLFINAFLIYGDNWDAVSTCVESRNASSVMRHYHNFFRKMDESFRKAAQKKSPKWSREEIEFYKKAVELRNVAESVETNLSVGPILQVSPISSSQPNSLVTNRASSSLTLKSSNRKDKQNTMYVFDKSGRHPQAVFSSNQAIGSKPSHNLYAVDHRTKKIIHRDSDDFFSHNVRNGARTTTGILKPSSNYLKRDHHERDCFANSNEYVSGGGSSDEEEGDDDYEDEDTLEDGATARNKKKVAARDYLVVNSVAFVQTHEHKNIKGYYHEGGVVTIIKRYTDICGLACADVAYHDTGVELKGVALCHIVPYQDHANDESEEEREEKLEEQEEFVPQNEEMQGGDEFEDDGIIETEAERKLRLKRKRGALAAARRRQKIKEMKLLQKQDEGEALALALEMSRTTDTNRTKTKTVKKTTTWAPTGFPPNNRVAIPVYQLTLSGEVIKCWPSAGQAANALMINRRGIFDCCKGSRKEVGGFRWTRTIDSDVVPSTSSSSSSTGNSRSKGHTDKGQSSSNQNIDQQGNQASRNIRHSNSQSSQMSPVEYKARPDPLWRPVTKKSQEELDKEKEEQEAALLGKFGDGELRKLTTGLKVGEELNDMSGTRGQRLLSRVTKRKQTEEEKKQAIQRCAICLDDFPGTNQELERMAKQQSSKRIKSGVPLSCMMLTVKSQDKDDPNPLVTITKLSCCGAWFHLSCIENCITKCCSHCPLCRDKKAKREVRYFMRAASDGSSP